MLPSNVSCHFLCLLIIGSLASDQLLAQDIDAIVGTYRRLPVENDWHIGTIERKGGRNSTQLRWKNKAGVSWNLKPALSKGLLLTDDTNPYQKSAEPNFVLEMRGEELIGFRFSSDLFVREGVEIIPQRSGGFHGYISMSAENPPPGFGYGASFYISVWPLLPEPLAGFQIGLPSTWIVPDNRDFTKPLCPPGTVARDNWPERGPYYRDVFQTIEGGLGYWVSTRFPSTTPKYRMNGTPNGYNHEISSPGWGFGKTTSLKAVDMGIAQLSNRLIVPPDGMTLQDDANGHVLGNAWMVLPLAPGDVDAAIPTGKQSWTLFLNTTNFKGPVAFWLPETWSLLSQGYDVIAGRGLDARPGLMGSGAMEVNTVPYFETKTKAGVVYSKIPALQFPVNERGETVLMQDVAFYQEKGVSSSGAFLSKKTWKPRLTARPLSFRQGPHKRPLIGFERTAETAIFGRRGEQAFGIRWKSAKGVGELPTYFRESGEKRVAIRPTRVPGETKLTTQTFANPRTTARYESPGTGVWSKPGPATKSMTVALNDGSVVTYAWYRSVDQPSIVALNWSATEKAEIQAKVERIHRDWPIDGEYLPAPSRGTLAAMDRALLVSPPAGLEVGYVPIALEQAAAK